MCNWMPKNRINLKIKCTLVVAKIQQLYVVCIFSNSALNILSSVVDCYLLLTLLKTL